MANKDHSLDDGIIQAAYSEFLAYGFQKASLHKIAEKAGVTTGAIYTRYKNKDGLFVSLLQDFFETMKTLFTPIAEEYEKARRSAQPEDILRAINAEERIYFQLLTEHYNDCTLFFCRSDGSSIENTLPQRQRRSRRSRDKLFLCARSTLRRSQCRRKNRCQKPRRQHLTSPMSAIHTAGRLEIPSPVSVFPSVSMRLSVSWAQTAAAKRQSAS